jgi:uncharacterized membrane protein
VVHGHRRLALHFALAVLIFIGLTLAGFGHLPTRLLIGWDAGIGLYLVTTLLSIGKFDLKRVQTYAAEQDEGAVGVLCLTVCAALASVVAVVAFLGGAKEGGGNLKALYFCFAIGTIIVSWCAIQTVFALHYAHEFYGDGRDHGVGGLKFPADAHPDYWDFIYFSVVIGMTFQVSDVQVTSKALRHIVALHGGVSFFFSVAILALAVNIGSNLI